MFYKYTLGYKTFGSAAFMLAMVITITGCSNEPTQQYLPAESKVIAIGDSLTYGYGASPDTAYPTVLAELTQWHIINAGVNGDTSAEVLARVDQIISQNPDLVLMGVGGNDVLQRVQPESTKMNIQLTIGKFKSADIPIILIAQPHFSASALLGRASDNPIYKDIAKSEEIPLYANGWSKVLSDDTLKSDQIHANAAGYRFFAEGLYDYLKAEAWVK